MEDSLERLLKGELSELESLNSGIERDVERGGKGLSLRQRSSSWVKTVERWQWSNGTTADQLSRPAAALV